MTPQFNRLSRPSRSLTVAGTFVAALSVGLMAAGCTNQDGKVDTSQGNPTNGPVVSDTGTATDKKSPVSNGPGADGKQAEPAAGKDATSVTNNTPKEEAGGPGGTMMNKPSKNPMGALGDGEITLRVKNALIADTNVAAREINVDTKSQVVVLRGKQASQAQIDAAVADAKKIKGVDKVINQLTIK